MGKITIFFQKIKFNSWAVPLAFLLVGAAIGWGAFWQMSRQTKAANTTQELHSGQNQYVNPLLECNEAAGAFVELTPFKDQVSGLVRSLSNNADVTDVALYFRDLNNGPWFGINQDASFSPASLLKVPLAIAYYELAETTQPGLLQKTLTFNGPAGNWPTVTQDIAPEKILKIGQTYTNLQLIQQMIQYSDNYAFYELLYNANLNELQNVYDDFGLQLGSSGPMGDTVVTVQNYSSFFRILFNASYLNQQDSNQLLSYLANSEFSSGLVAGVPSSMLVAHKFGERELATSNVKQISDCGIVYYPQHPYLLCIMTKGTDLSVQSDAIKQLSADVYQQVDSQYSGN